MKKLALLLIAIIILIAGGFFIFVHFISGGPWQGTWWGVQDAGINWSGDNIRNLETINFTKNEDGTINVDHKVQQGSREVDGSLAGTGVVDGGRLVVTPKKGGKDLALSYNTISKTMDTPFTNADGSTVTLKPLTQDNNDEMERIRSEIVQISQKPENKIDTTISTAKS
ncbi:succinate dehydrogenase [uncultured Dialister sp.]|uniref:succinate dehydrogenase n=1 Tax=uncultured Dialister sp. TaxID=278064 RepID=UPI0025E4C118|nr:succinate dehydrogenase [uncultured Dialister sp.]